MRTLPMHGAPPDDAPGGLPLLAKGFRPFFLLAAGLAATLAPAWLLVLEGRAHLDAYVDSTAWHGHEMIFGFTVAVVAGFLLTAVENWTGLPTARGVWLSLLAALFVAGRVVFVLPGLPRALVAGLDLAFLPALAFAVGRPLALTRNRRNFVMVAALLLLFALDLAFHLGLRRPALVGAVDVIVLLVVLISARVFPMFTRNATGDANIRSRPKADILAALCVAVLALIDVAVPGAPALLVAGFALFAAGMLVVRAWHWGARSSLGDPMLWILHAANAWIVLGLVLRAVSVLAPGSVPPSAALHAWTAGAIGSSTLGMMARVALGHTGRRIAASRVTRVAFALVTFAGLARTFGPIAGASFWRLSLLAAGTAWACAFLAYLVTYAAPLVRARADGKPG